MKLLRKTEEFRQSAGSSVVTIGVFDGVHKGHEAIINTCVARAKEHGTPSVVLTFDRNPRKVISDEFPCVLTSRERKLELIEGLGVDYTVMVRFDEGFASLSPGKFCGEVLAGDLGAVRVCVGEDFHFGAGGRGDIHSLAGEGERLGFEVEILTQVELGSCAISSTLVRKMIREGKVSDVIAALGRPYSMAGRVVTGHSRGKELGFPTANLRLERDFCIPKEGVYAGKATLEGRKHLCAANVGSNPTFGDAESVVEVYVLDFEGDIYGESMDVEFHHRLRDEIAFESEKELISQMESDVTKARTLLGKH
jgi:riboflavin kinase/FMN adenylyltransferase